MERDINATAIVGIIDVDSHPSYYDHENCKSVEIEKSVQCLGKK